MLLSLVYLRYAFINADWMQIHFKALNKIHAKFYVQVFNHVLPIIGLSRLISKLIVQNASQVLGTATQVDYLIND